MGDFLRIYSSMKAILLLFLILPLSSYSKGKSLKEAPSPTKSRERLNQNKKKPILFKSRVMVFGLETIHKNTFSKKFKRDGIFVSFLSDTPLRNILSTSTIFSIHFSKKDKNKEESKTNLFFPRISQSLNLNIVLSEILVVPYLVVGIGYEIEDRLSSFDHNMEWGGGLKIISSDRLAIFSKYTLNFNSLLKPAWRNDSKSYNLALGVGYLY